MRRYLLGGDGVAQLAGSLLRCDPITCATGCRREAGAPPESRTRRAPRRLPRISRMSDLSHLPLGRFVAGSEHYDPALLCTVPRAGQRAQLGFSDNTLPFVGVDLWNAYELSWLTPAGKPQVAMASFAVPAESPNLVESKSLKLYLNSFTQTRLRDRTDLLRRLSADLGAAFGTLIGVHLTGPEAFAAQRSEELAGQCIDELDVSPESYGPPDPALLMLATGVPRKPVEETLVSHLLKTNCLVTGQPDWASVQIRYTGQPIDRAGLLKYLITFRNHHEFHEHCVERIWRDIHERCQPESLAVYARYTRRGGLDINPFRASHSARPWPENLRTARQ